MDARKRSRSDSTNGNGLGTGPKRFKETDSNQPGLGSKSKPCTKFFSTSGCPFGEGCHFLHYVPGGISAISQMTNLNHQAVPPARNMIPSHSIPNGLPPAAVKTRMCNKYNTAEGCKFGEKCHYAHGERELGKPVLPSHDGHVRGPIGGRLGASMELPQPAGLAAATSFGASATAKISVDASLAGAIIGKDGVNTKQICRITGVKLAIREHESDPNLRNIELEGSFDQIKHASTMVRELIGNISSNTPFPAKNSMAGGPAALGSSRYKTKVCDNFTKGSCTFGDRCHFAHGANELRKSAV
ncbi:hypothetical protein Cni_G25997 [Canna indica]|uniref:C3H1-type domain-containing protein n=1 Tax=Canna indica TaxID=4628 RepID=A0AAQ3KY47_9LILI|nr:hypothetical protein Cni_G25997 [Canna indica]